MKRVIHPRSCSPARLLQQQTHCLSRPYGKTTGAAKVPRSSVFRQTSPQTATHSGGLRNC